MSYWCGIVIIVCRGRSRTSSEGVLKEIIACGVCIKLYIIGGGGGGGWMTKSTSGSAPACIICSCMHPFVLLAAETSEGSSNLKKMDIGEYSILHAIVALCL